MPSKIPRVGRRAISDTLWQKLYGVNQMKFSKKKKNDKKDKTKHKWKKKKLFKKDTDTDTDRRQYRFELPPEFPLTLPCSSIVHHLTGPTLVLFFESLSRSRAVAGARIQEFTFFPLAR